MPNFSLTPIELADFSGTQFVHTVTMYLAAEPDKVWEELNGESPLHWCKGLKSVVWQDKAPYGVSTRRRATLNPPIGSLNETYIAWDDSGEVKMNAFTVLSATVPGFKRFGEHYQVEPYKTGTKFTWTFYSEPKGGAIVWKVVKPIAALSFSGFAKDTERYFGKLEG